MIKFKDILKEVEMPNAPVKEESLKKLKKQIETGNWIVRNPLIYRERNWDGQIKPKNSESKGKREPRDTDRTIDFLFHNFIQNCYPKYPDRRQSRFGMVYRHFFDYSDYGDHIYVIFPHKNSKISSFKVDSFNFFVDGFDDYSFQKALEYLIEDENLKKIKSNINDRAVDLIKKLYKIKFENEEIDIFGEFGCLKQIYFVLSQAKKSVDGIAENSFDEIIDVFYIIKEYMDTSTRGYPESKSEAEGEVVYQGKYLQVHEEVWTKFKKENQKYLNKKFNLGVEETINF